MCHCLMRKASLRRTNENCSLMRFPLCVFYAFLQHEFCLHHRTLLVVQRGSQVDTSSFFTLFSSLSRVICIKVCEYKAVFYIRIIEKIRTIKCIPFRIPGYRHVTGESLKWRPMRSNHPIIMGQSHHPQREMTFASRRIP